MAIESSFMESLKSMKLEYNMERKSDTWLEIIVERITDVHLTLPEYLVAGLDRMARQRGIQRAPLVREVIAAYLTGVEAERIAQEMSEYVEALAPYSDEFVRETDAHTVQRLLEETEW